MFRLRNPLPQNLRDDTRLRNFFKEFNLVPYAGSANSTGHSLLKILIDLYDLSSSHADCVDQKALWSFQGGVSVSRSPVLGLSIESDDVPEAQQVDYAQTLFDMGLSIDKLIDCSIELSRNLDLTGTAALLVTESVEGGVVGFDVESVHPLNWMFHLTDQKRANAVVIGKRLFEGYFYSDDLARMVRVFPEWTERDGLRETVFILRNKRDYSKYYGRPQTLPAIWWKFVEWQSANHTGKVTSADLVALAFLLMEKAEPNLRRRGESEMGMSSGKAAANELRKLTTNRGGFDEAETLGVLEYPHGGQAPKLETLGINRDSTWLMSVTDRASDYIYSAHNWSKIISGFSRTKGSLGSNILVNEFIVCNEKAISPRQSLIERFWKSVTDYMLDRSGNTALMEYKFSFEDRISSLIEKLKGDDENTPDGIGGNILD